MLPRMLAITEGMTALVAILSIVIVGVVVGATMGKGR